MDLGKLYEVFELAEKVVEKALSGIRKAVAIQGSIQGGVPEVMVLADDGTVCVVIFDKDLKLREYRILGRLNYNLRNIVHKALKEGKVEVEWEEWK